MNKIIKTLITRNINSNLLRHKKTTTGDKYTVFNSENKEVLSVDDGWARNHYSVSVNKKPALAVRWDETNSKPLTPEQKDMIDIINSCKEKIDMQETVQSMTESELEMAKFLQHSLCKI
jgi:hypothetical protein